MSEINIKKLTAMVESQVRKKLGPAFESKLRTNLLNVLNNEVRQVIFAEFIKQYDILTNQEKSEFGPAIKGKDPSALEEFRELFIEQITKELDNIRIEGDSIIIEVGNRDLWGFGRGSAPQGTPKSVDFLYYYIVGVVGEFGFITLEHYKKRRRRTTKIGRFGKGFLISKEDYKKEFWERITKVSFEEIRHPISGQPGFKGFDTISETFDINPYVQKAVEKTFAEEFKT